MTSVLESLKVQGRLLELAKTDEQEAALGGAGNPSATGKPAINRLTGRDLVNAMRDGQSEFQIAANSSRDFRNSLDAGGIGELLIDRNLAESLRISQGDNAPLLGTSTIITRESGLNRSIPLADDQSIEAAIVPSGGANATTDVSKFGRRKLSAVRFDAPRLKVTRDVLEDAPELAAAIFSIIGGRLGRGQNRAFTTGTGGNQPEGILTAAPVAATSGSPTSFALDNVLSLVAANPSPYRRRSKFMGHANIELACWQLKDGIGNYVWRSSGMSEFEFVKNSHMPSAVAAGQKILLFGDLAQFVILQVGPVYVQSLTEMAAPNEIIFEGRIYANGALADPSGLAVQALQIASS
jgi:HK97 family phage major capsid protein